ncbi:MAG: GNAT family N-acetyltransferase [Azonexus sp.]
MYSVKIFNSIRDVPSEPWNALVAGHSSTYSHEFWEVLEDSGLNDFRYNHALIYDQNSVPVALASFYTITTDIAIFSTGWLKKALNAIRSIFPGFLKFKMIECGTPITMNKPIVVKAGCNEEEILAFLDTTLSDIAKKQRAFVVVIRDFEPRNAYLEPHIRNLNYHVVASLPNTFMDITWQTPDQYLSSLKSHYRRKILIHQKSNEDRGIRYELRDDFGELADSLRDQWLVVHESAKEFQRERLTPEFYREFSAKLGSKSKALLFYRDDELVGHVLLFVDGEILRWLYVGRKESVKDNLYFYMCHKIVETAILLRVKRLELGLTTYEPKLNLGAQTLPVNIAIKTARIPNIFTGYVYSLLNHTPEIRSRNIFKHSEGEKAS